MEFARLYELRHRVQLEGVSPTAAVPAGHTMHWCKVALRYEPAGQQIDGSIMPVSGNPAANGGAEHTGDVRGVVNVLARSHSRPQHEKRRIPVRFSKVRFRA